MKEYIEREALIKKICNSCDGWCDKVDCDCVNCKREHRCEFMKDVANQPTVDVVEVVRCEKCLHKVDFKGRVMCNRNAHRVCDEWYGLTATDNNHFCSYGVRKDK